MRMTNKQRALDRAAERAAEALRGIDLAGRCASLGLPVPDPDGSLRLEMLGRELVFAGPDWRGHVADTDNVAHPIDRLLVLHYLTCRAPVRPTGRWMTFRQFPGGQFYWRPFRARAVLPLLREIGNDVELLRARLGRYDWRPMESGDLAARIRVLGNVELGLVYHAGDAELPAEADVLFDSALRRIYATEGAAALAARVCLGLCRNACEPCFDCDLCDTATRENE